MAVTDDVENSPLCIEEFDLSDKNFRPCPCGYQVSGTIEQSTLEIPRSISRGKRTDRRFNRSVSSVSTASRPPTRKALVQIAAESMMKKQFSTRYLQRRNSSSTSRTRSRNKLRLRERRARSAKSKPPVVAISLASESNSKTLFT